MWLIVVSALHTSTTHRKGEIGHPSLGNQAISPQSVDGENPSDVRWQQFPQGVDGRQLSVAGNRDRFHEEMSSKKMSNHLKGIFKKEKNMLKRNLNWFLWLMLS